MRSSLISYEAFLTALSQPVPLLSSDFSNQHSSRTSLISAMHSKVLGAYHKMAGLMRPLFTWSTVIQTTSRSFNMLSKTRKRRFYKAISHHGVLTIPASVLHLSILYAGGRRLSHIPLPLSPQSRELRINSVW